MTGDNKDNQQDQQKQQNAVLNKINSGELKMRPKFYFVLQGFLTAATAILLFMISIFLISFIFYLLRVNNADREDLHLFLQFFPWILIGAALLITIALSLILKKYSFAYHKPLLFLPLGIILIIIALSLIMQLFAFHERFEPLTERRGTPLFSPFYHSAPIQPPRQFRMNYYRLEKSAFPG